MQRKKLLFVSLAAYPLFNKTIEGVHGGAELDLYTVARHLNSSKFEVHFLVGDYGQKAQEERFGVFIHRGQKISNSNAAAGLVNFFKLFRLVRKINPEVIFTEAAGWLTVELIIIKIILRKKLVFRSAHENNINGFTDSRSYGLLYRKLLPNINHIILQNEQDIEILKSKFKYIKNVSVIRNLQNIPPNEPLSLEKRLHHLWVGRSEKIKDPQAFIDLVKELPDNQFVMIMPKTNTDVFNNIKEQAQNLSNLRFIPGVKWGEIMPYFIQAKYLINTSIGEGFPNVILEAMKHGTPIISTRLDFDSIITKQNCGIIGGTDIKNLAKKIISIENSQWRKYSNNCYKFSKNNFDIIKGIHEYEQLFLQV